ncbi:MAG: PilZ domain-containing protein [Candidatus Omnitrophica bacterium]|nr:PilZ domain-containing protein [Candidatus Omnitrophota bacterium]
MPFSERRKHPRISEAVSCQVSIGTERFRTVTKNISCGGALCVVSGEVPPMTKLRIDLELPGTHGAGASARQVVHCEGVVVRQDKLPLSADPAYLTAIFFSDIQQEDRRRIGEFVLHSMLAHDRSPGA